VTLSFTLKLGIKSSTITGIQDNNYRVTVLDPLGRLIGVFPDFNEAIKKRQKKLLDYDRLRANVRKLVDKPSEDTSKLPRVSFVDWIENYWRNIVLNSKLKNKY
jgi:hypothetical protein